MKDAIKNLFARLLRKRNAAEAGPEIVDPIIGEIRKDPALEGSFLANVGFNDRQIPLRIDPDGENFQDCVQTAQTLVETLPALNEKALRAASRDLLKNYNENWRVFDQAQPDGSMESIKNPVLATDEFVAKFSLDAVSVIGTLVEFWYSDTGLFADHSIVVTTFDGLEFSNVEASIFG